MARTKKRQSKKLAQRGGYNPDNFASALIYCARNGLTQIILENKKDTTNTKTLDLLLSGQNPSIKYRNTDTGNNRQQDLRQYGHHHVAIAGWNVYVINGDGSRTDFDDSPRRGVRVPASAAAAAAVVPSQEEVYYSRPPPPPSQGRRVAAAAAAPAAVSYPSNFTASDDEIVPVTLDQALAYLAKAGGRAGTTAASATWSGVSCALSVGYAGMVNMYSMLYANREPIRDNTMSALRGTCFALTTLGSALRSAGNSASAGAEHLLNPLLATYNEIDFDDVRGRVELVRNAFHEGVSPPNSPRNSPPNSPQPASAGDINHVLDNYNATCTIAVVPNQQRQQRLVEFIVRHIQNQHMMHMMQIQIGNKMKNDDSNTNYNSKYGGYKRKTLKNKSRRKRK
jgi:hypothetical protein